MLYYRQTTGEVSLRETIRPLWMFRTPWGWTCTTGSFHEEPGIFPGWHRNKAHWLTVELDGTVADEKLRFLVNMRYELTER